MDAIGAASVKLTKNLTGVDDESKDAGAALKALGLNIEEFKALKPEDQMVSLANALGQFEDGAAMPLPVLVPAFLLSEIKRGFEVGFLIFLPFLVIDLVIAAVLMSMGMMMVPPAVVSLPFKLAFFVIADGWSLLAGAMVRSYAP